MFGVLFEFGLYLLMEFIPWFFIERKRGEKLGGRRARKSAAK